MTDQIVILNFYDASRVLTISRPAEVIPGVCIESAADFPNCTDTPLPEIPAGHTAQLSASEPAFWALIEDHRGAPAWRKSDAEAVIILAAGPISDEVTLLPPPEFSRWHEPSGGWVFDRCKYLPMRLSALEAHYRLRLQRGFIYADRLIQADMDSQNKITGAMSVAMLHLQTGEPFSIDWICADNSVLQLDAAGMAAMGVACGEFVRACFYRRRALKDELSAAETRGQMDAIDITAGWPETVI